MTRADHLALTSEHPQGRHGSRRTARSRSPHLCHEALLTLHARSMPRPETTIRYDSSGQRRASSTCSSTIYAVNRLTQSGSCQPKPALSSEWLDAAMGPRHRIGQRRRGPVFGGSPRAVPTEPKTISPHLVLQPIDERVDGTTLPHDRNHVEEDP